MEPWSSPPRIKVEGQSNADNGWLHNGSAPNQPPCSGVGIALYYVYARRNHWLYRWTNVYELLDCCCPIYITYVEWRMLTLKYHMCVLILSVDWYSIKGLVLTSSVSGRNACHSEEVTFTCTAQGDALFWRNEAFEEISMYYMSLPSRGEDFRAEIVSYDRNQSCLVSSLSFRATASRNGTTVTCTSRDRSSSQSSSLHIMSSESVRHFLTVGC